MVMREIKFRGKRLDNGEWVHGDLLHIDGSCLIYFGSKDQTSELEIDRNYVIAVEIFRDEIAVVDPSTIGQYTGLKDKNGREIYEGDIIGGSNGSINGWEWPFKSEIKWNDEECGFNTPNWGYMDSTHYYNVLGNIHDNPELLKGGEQ